MHADRKYLKQDFTPHSVSKLIAALVDKPEDDGHTFYEACAGTGSMTISAWHKHKLKHSPLTYKPSMYLYHVEELSHRAIPFLIFNLAMRGMNAIVVHCDVLTRKAYGAFFIQNDTDNPLQFSSINLLPYTDDVANAMGYPVIFTSHYYEPLIESPEHIEHLAEEMEQIRGKASYTEELELTESYIEDDFLLLNIQDAITESVQQTLF